MNVAPLELCKELYELSGWGDTEWQYTGTLHGLAYKPMNANDTAAIPAYDLGYLLRKLPLERTSEFGTELTLHLYFDPTNSSKGWIAEYTDGNYVALEANLSGEAGFPEDAVCKLAIELFKQNILKK